MINIRDYKKNKALNKDLTYLLKEFDNIKRTLIKYKIYKEVHSIIDLLNIGSVKYKKVLEKINNEK